MGKIERKDTDIQKRFVPPNPIYCVQLSIRNFDTEITANFTILIVIITSSFFGFLAYWVNQTNSYFNCLNEYLLSFRAISLDFIGVFSPAQNLDSASGS